MPVATLAPVDERKLRFSRRIRAPRAKVWAAWTDPTQLPQWWGPRSFTCETESIDIRPGGHWVFDMVGPNGQRWPNRLSYTAIDPMDRIAWTAAPGPDAPGFEATAQFFDDGPSTRIDGEMIFETPEVLGAMQEIGALEGALHTLDKLSERLLGKDHALALTRVLNAAQPKVWAAWTDPKALTRWFCPDDITLTGAAFDVREGGAYEARFRGNESGAPFVCAGTYTRIAPEHEIAFTHGWRNDAGEIGRETEIVVTLAGAGARTILTFEQTGLTDAAATASHTEGWGQVLDNLSRTLGATA